MAPLSPCITTEVGRLRSVVLHRPGLELRRITPLNKDALLFDELVWVTKAQEEHDAFADVLRREGVDVRLLTDLLVEVVSAEEPRQELIGRMATVHTCGVELVHRVRSHLQEMPPADLVAHVIGGLLVSEVPGASEGFVGGVLGPQAFLLPPLPNTVFTRDPSVWIGDGVALAPMQMAARRAEQHLWEVLYRHHPELQEAAARRWYGVEATGGPPASLEGGDVLVLSDRCVAIGLSQRTHPVAAENLAARLFEAGVAEWVLALDLPKARGTMHLDTVMTVVDEDAIVVWPRARDVIRGYRIRPGRGRMRVSEEPDLLRVVADGLGVESLRVITTGEDEVTADREQWDDGNNTLAVRPGRVVAYERNVDTNRRLADAGIEVLAISSYELPRGRGGPRCMSCPLRRDPV